MERKGDYRILCLGESTTYGEYPRFLERILNQANIGVRFSVVNKGIPGTNTTAILSRIEADLEEYHPQMVVAMMGINDFGEHMPLGMVPHAKGADFIQSLRIYKLASLLGLHLRTKAEALGLYKPHGDPLKPGDDAALLRLGRLYQERNELTQAERLFKKAIDMNPESSKAYEELGWNYRHQDKMPQAEELLRKAVELDPKNETACLRLAKTLQLSGKPAGVEALLAKALELDPGDANANFHVGRIHRIHGELERAKDYQEKAVDLDPRDIFALIELGELYRKLNMLAQAEALYAKAMAIMPENDRGFGAMASLLEETGRSERAQAFAEKATQLRSASAYSSIVNNHRKLKAILDRKGIRLVCAQYPMRSVASLKKLFEDSEGVVFVDNEGVFKEALKQGGYREYFIDTFGGDFGHCTQKGNELLAQNIADVILREVFNKR